MSITKTRTKIEQASDIADGCGLGVKLESLGLKVIKCGTETYINGGVAGKQYPFIHAHFAPTFNFEAGYDITADYVFEVNVDNESIDSLEDRIKAIQNNVASIGIEHDHLDSLSYNNWYLTAHDAEVLKEIEDVSEDAPALDYSFDLGETVTFGYDMSASDVAYGLEANIKLSNNTFQETGFTKEFVTALHQQIRDEICRVLTETGNAK